MKKVLAIALISVFVWSCSKKMTPAKTEEQPSGINSVSSTSNPSTTSPAVTTTTATKVDPAAASAAGARPAAVNSNDPAVAGQATYNAKCGRCHGLKVVSDYTADRWVSIMQVMAMKANLSETEKANVLVYVKTNAKQG